jgi:hypothetical protein
MTDLFERTRMQIQRSAVAHDLYTCGVAAVAGLIVVSLIQLAT